MAQKRMIDKKISISEQVSNLPLEAQLIFTWSIPHADDLGLLPISTKTLKAMIVPMMDMSVETFQFQVSKIVEQGLWETFGSQSGEFYRIIKFKDHQTLKKDRKPNTYLHEIENWDQVEKLGFHLEDNGNPSKVKLSKVKLSKYTAQGADVLKAFETIDPKNKSYYANKTQREACEFLIKEYGKDEISKRIKVIPQTNKLEYFPRIYTPYDLKEKWCKLNTAVESYKNKIPLMI